jgi:hypothetical protein
MEPNDYEVDLRKANFQLNGANEMLMERINKFNRNYSNLKVRHEKIKELSSSIKKISQNNWLRLSIKSITFGNLLSLTDTFPQPGYALSRC